jgi:hypothetical protein
VLHAVFPSSSIDWWLTGPGNTVRCLSALIDHVPVCLGLWRSTAMLRLYCPEMPVRPLVHARQLDVAQGCVVGASNVVSPRCPSATGSLAVAAGERWGLVQ